MEFNVINHQLIVSDIHITGIASAALFHIGDVQTIQLSSAFDTPPESLIIGASPALFPTRKA